VQDMSTDNLLQVYACTASPLDQEHVVDTTGAGDAFIASLLYGLVRGKSFEEMLRLGTVVAACKCTQLGARPGLPRHADISPDLL
jgi:sugar/nucleoside kinase (ribokinase family)